MTFEENVIYGDASVTEGLNVLLKTNYYENVFWDSLIHFGNSLKTNTQYKFSSISKSYEKPITYEGLRISMGAYYNIQSFEDKTGMKLAYSELFDSLEPGEENSRIVYLKDYVDYYDFEVCFDFPGAVSWYYNTMDAVDPSTFEEYYDPYNDDLFALKNYFKIPVLTTETHKVIIGKHPNGSLSHVGAESTSSDNFSLDLKTIMTDNTCYFTFNPYSFEGQAIDTSLLPNGFGIFALPYEANAANDEECVKTELLSMVYPIDTNVEVYDLQMNEDQTLIFLYTIEENQLFLSIIEIATMETVQKQVIADLSEGTALYLLYKDNVILITNRSNNTITVFQETENHVYNLEFTCNFDPKDEFFSRFYAVPHFDYNGEYLVYAGIDEKWRENNNEYCNFLLTIYNKDGLQYIGKYENSLDSGVDNDSYDYSLKADHHDAFEIYW